MTSPAAVLSILVTANTAQATTALAKTQTQLKATTATANTAAATMGSRLATGAKYGALGMAGLGAASVKMAVDFDKSMRNVNSIAQLNEKQFQSLGKEVRALAGKTAQSPQTLAEGLYDLVSSGFDARESMKVLASSARAATAGLTDTATSTKAVAAVLNAYRLPADKAKKVSDVLFRTVDRGVISFEELAGTIGNVLPAATTLGVKLPEVGAAISTLTKQGQSGATAVTNINAAMTALFKPSEAMKAALQDIGYESSQSLVKAEGFEGALLKLIEATDGSAESIGALFQNVRAQRAVFGLTGKNAEAAMKDLEGLKDSAGATQRALDEQSKSVAFAWNKLKAQASSLAIGIGDKLIPALRDMLKVMSSKKLTLDEKVAAVIEKIVEQIEKWGPKVAEAGAKIGVALLRGIATAFWNADILGKLFIAGTFIRLVGGPGALAAIGTALGNPIGAAAAVAIAGAVAFEMERRHHFAGKALFDRTTYFDSDAFQDQLRDLEGMNKQALYRLLQDWQAGGNRINKATVYMWQRQGKITALGAVHLLAVIERMQKNTRAAFDKLADQARRAGGAVRGFADNAAGWLRDLARGGREDLIDLSNVFKGPLTKALERAGDDVRDFTRDAIDALDKLYDKGGKSTEDLSAKVKKMASKVGASMMGVAQVVTHGLDIIVTNTNKALQGFGVKKVAISLTHVGDVAKGFQAGGVIVPGQGSGDKVPAMLEPGEVVLNREAVAAMGGAERANSINRKIPRFAKGGKVSGSMAAMLGLVNKYEQASYPYLWGGGHGGFPNGSSPVDCSGFVSDVLHAGGLLSGAPMVSGALMSWGKPASGNEPLVVYANPGHTVMSLNGRVAGTSGSNPGGGAGWIEGGNGASLAPGAKRTMDVAGAAAAIAEKIARIILKGPDGPLKDMGQAALDKARNAANKYIASKMPSGTPGGGNVGDTIAKTMTGTATWYGPLTSQLGAPVSGGGGLLSGNENAFAELGRGTSVGTALGSLPMGTWIKATILGHTANLEKRDVGQGGASTDLVDVWEDSLVNFPGLREAGRAKIKVEPTHKQTGGIIQRLAKGGLVEDLKKVLDVTRKSENDKRRKRVMKDYLKNLKGIGLNDNLSKALKALDEQQAMYGEYAGYAESLAEDGIDRFKGKTQAEWLQQQLNTLFRLRNKLVRAEKVIHRRQREIAKLLTYAEKQQKAIKKAVRLADREKDDLQKQIDREKKEKKPNRELIKHLEKRVGSIDERQKMRNAGLAALKDKIIPAVKAKKTGLAELYTTHRDRLAEVQGPGMPLEHLKSAPYGQLGGEILAVQQQIRGIGGDSTARDSDRLEIIEDLLRQSQQRLAVSQSQYRIFSATPVLGAFAKGGTAMATGSYLVGERGPEVVHLRTGDTVSPNASSFSPSVNVAVTLYEDRDKALVDVNGKEFVAAVKRVNRGQARSGGRVLPGRAGS